jgi:hypothetical protein
MHEAILSNHPRMSPPATCIKNESRIPIDSIWCSKGIRPIAAGFLRFGQATLSDHRAVWADFQKTDLLGAAMAEFRPSVSLLRAEDPRDRRKYNERSHKLLHAHNVTARLVKLDSIDASPTSQDIAEYDTLMDLNTEIRTAVKVTSSAESNTGPPPGKLPDSDYNSGAGWSLIGPDISRGKSISYTNSTFDAPNQYTGRPEQFPD